MGTLGGFCFCSLRVASTGCGSFFVCIFFVLLWWVGFVVDDFFDPGFGYGDSVGEVGFVDECDDGDVGFGLFPEVADADAWGWFLLVGFFWFGPVVSS